MAMAIPFDTLKFVRKLTAAGFTQPQAEAQADAFKEAHEENIDMLATKQDLKETEQRLELKISEQKNDIIKWVLSIVLAVSAAQAGIIITILKLGL